MNPICESCVHKSVRQNFHNSETLECWGCKYAFEGDYYEEVLKKCPFCGGTAQVRTHDRGDYYGEDYSVECEGCGIETPLFKTKKEAIYKWNRRV